MLFALMFSTAPLSQRHASKRKSQKLKSWIKNIPNQFKGRRRCSSRYIKLGLPFSDTLIWILDKSEMNKNLFTFYSKRFIYFIS